MIDNILGNKTCISVLRLLSRSVNRYFSVKEIQANIPLGFGNLFNALKVLGYHQLVLLSDSKVKKYKINYQHPLNLMLIGVFSAENSQYQNIDLELLKALAALENEILRDVPKVKDIILFGSIARGAYTEKSDIDIAIIKDVKNPKDKILLAKIAGKYERNIQPHIFSAEEILQNKEPLIRNIRKEGISLKEF